MIHLFLTYCAGSALPTNAFSEALRDVSLIACVPNWRRSHNDNIRIVNPHFELFNSYALPYLGGDECALTN